MFRLELSRIVSGEEWAEALAERSDLNKCPVGFVVILCFVWLVFGAAFFTSLHPHTTRSTPSPNAS